MTWREAIRDVAGLGGCGMIATGSGMIYLPAGLIIGGMLILVLAVLSGGKR